MVKKIIHQSFKQIWWLISWPSNQIAYGTYSNKNKMVNDMQWTLISWVIKYFVYETTYIVQKTCYLLIAECSMKYARAERKFFADRINIYFTVAIFFPLVHFISCHGKCIQKLRKTYGISLKCDKTSTSLEIGQLGRFRQKNL